MAHQKSVWDYTNLSDRETLISGALAWLLDPLGDHQNGAALLRRVLDQVGVGIPEKLDALTVETEARGKRSRRFDVSIGRESIEDEVERLLILEVKCKTRGSAKQLQKYAGDEPDATIARVGFAEWNYPALGDEHQKQFPLITFEQLAALIRETHQGPETNTDMVTSLVGHLERETKALGDLRAYYVEESLSEPPRIPGSLSLSRRFVQRLLWRWFIEQEEVTASDWTVRSQTTGVWCAGHDTSARDGSAVEFPALGLSLPGPVHTWIHLELRGNLFGSEDARVGKAELRIRGDHEAPEHRKRVFQRFRDAESPLRNRGWTVRKQRPGKNDSSYYAIKRWLTVSDLRFSKLKQLVRDEMRSVVVPSS